MKKIALLVTFVSCVLCQSAFAQQSTKDSTTINKINKESSAVAAVTQDSVIVPQLRKSPMAIAKYQSNAMYIKAVYGQPSKRGRVIFGELEPYGKVWRTGANEATEITFTKDVKIAGKSLKAGTYTLFTIPNRDKWTVIINSDLGQWGAYKYEKEKDLFSLDVPVTKPEYQYEAFTIEFEETRTGVDMELLWDTTRIAVPLTFAK
ncbi:DUF2911 domain-containing protein [Rhodocytophaga rosea]|uniref:DUF2911 domain-containing protein n=1 Tax=Rhodocytophaga rosea TaxID=2704465 RepID=A0A6C0GCX0_9BACT|nr:DUF2911 domain-containing protein [Rhodocytophaga rosea]QHT65728.1 DUF2911 domain-containing protein [Rhodocytophaga rosea]